MQQLKSYACLLIVCFSFFNTLIWRLSLRLKYIQAKSMFVYCLLFINYFFPLCYFVLFFTWTACYLIFYPQENVQVWAGISFEVIFLLCDFAVCLFALGRKYVLGLKLWIDLHMVKRMHSLDLDNLRVENEYSDACVRSDFWTGT